MRAAFELADIPARTLQLTFMAWWFVAVSASRMNGFLSKESQLFTPADTLVSTLGFFKITLLSKHCQLQVEEFQDDNYKVVGYFNSLQLPTN